MKIKTISGHLTARKKKAIKAILEAGLTTAKVGRTNYKIVPYGSIYRVHIASRESQYYGKPKLVVYTSLFKLLPSSVQKAEAQNQ